MKILTGCIIFLFHLSGITHNINMTVTDISNKENKLEMRIKFFADDLQGSLSKMNKVPVDLLYVPIGENETIIKKYIDQRLKIVMNEMALKWIFKKAYLSGDVIFVEYEMTFSNFNNVKSLKIKNTLMFEDFPEQKNIVNVKINDHSKTLIFDNGKDFKFKLVGFH